MGLTICYYYLLQPHWAGANDPVQVYSPTLKSRPMKPGNYGISPLGRIKEQPECHRGEDIMNCWPLLTYLRVGLRLLEETR